ncbi:MAG: hypothetical protein HY940_02735 [Gammaproteobacteria bacterium]|nr:hypothetical protein [Gammaproteobacteria bacterium]
MYPVLVRFIDICRLHCGPQHLPDSRFLLALTLLGYLSAGMMAAVTDLVSLFQALVISALNLTLLAVFLYLLLWINNLSSRFSRSLTAISGCSALIDLCSIPLLLWAQLATQGKLPGLLLSSVLLWTALLWQAVVVGHILRYALATLLPIAMSLSVLYTLISFNINRMLFANLN